MQRSPDLSRAFLLLAAVGLIPVALSYGLAPAQSLPWMFGIDAADTNTRQIFRAIMGLYLGFVCLWIAGALRADLRRAALWSLVVFMAGLGLGRLVSLIVDGWPHPLLVVYTLVEFGGAAIGIYLLQADEGDRAPG